MEIPSWLLVGLAVSRKGSSDPQMPLSLSSSDAVFLSKILNTMVQRRHLLVRKEKNTEAGGRVESGDS